MGWGYCGGVEIYGAKSKLLISRFLNIKGFRWMVRDVSVYFVFGRIAPMIGGGFSLQRLPDSLVGTRGSIASRTRAKHPST